MHQPVLPTLSRRALLGAALASLLTPARAASFPDRPLHLVIPAAPGGVQDVQARRVAPLWGDALGQTVIVDNRPGAAGSIAFEYTARASADGYTMMMGTVTMTILPHLMKVAWDPLRDFAAVVRYTSGSLILVAHPGVPVESASGLADYARRERGLKIGGFGTGSLAHLTALQIGKAVGAPVVHIPYAGGAQQLTDLVSGQVPLLLDYATVLLPHLKAGKAKALGVTGERRSTALPEVPTLDEQGLAVRATGWQGILVPAATPPEVVRTLHAGFIKALAAPDLRALILATGGEIGGDTPEAFSDFIRAEHARWGRVIAENGVRLQ
jgi:tripartite-type tricarboxylate transporter receptor subunit TctC